MIPKEVLLEVWLRHKSLERKWGHDSFVFFRKNYTISNIGIHAYKRKFFVADFSGMINIRDKKLIADFGTHLRKLRHDRGFSQQQVSF